MGPRTAEDGAAAAGQIDEVQQKDGQEEQGRRRDEFHGANLLLEVQIYRFRHPAIRNHLKEEGRKSGFY